MAEKDRATLIGTLSAKGSLIGGLSVKGSLQGSLSNPKISDYPTYNGEYEIEPSVKNRQTLETKNKILVDDIVVKKIHYSETDNLSDGITVYIGKDLI